MSTVTDKPFGAWESPISSRSITAGSIRIGGLAVVPATDKEHQDDVYWLEGRPLEGGRNVLCKYTSEGAVSEITPKEINVRSRVHEYGGAATTIAGDTLFYTEFASQQVYKLSLSEHKDKVDEEAKATAVTNDDDGKGQYRYADGIYDAQRGVMICVREDHGPEGTADPKDVVNEIVALDIESGNTRVLVTGYDFAASPRLSTDGKTLACIVWDHPNMPWDATKLVTVALSENLFGDSASASIDIGSPVVIAGQDGDTSVMQPLFHPVTGNLLYLSDESGYYNLYAAAAANNNGDGDESTKTSKSILPMDVDFGGASPGWALGQMGYCVLEDGRLAASIGRNGSSVLVVIDVEQWDPVSEDPVSTIEFTASDGLPMQFGSIQAGTNGDLYFMGGDPSTPTSVYRWNMNKQGACTILKSSSKSGVPSSVISVPRRVEFPTTLGTAFGYYYPPKNGDFECTTESAPPLLVKAHGG